MSRPLSDKSWQYRALNAQTPSLSALSDALIELVQAGEPVVARTADLQYSNGLVKFAQACPDRFIQFGISEQNMVSAAAGMAAVGLKPYVATFASFLALLCCEQIRTDVAYSGLPVRLIGHHAGISLGFYGTSHHATEDLAIMRSIADLTVVAPADGAQLKAVIKASADYPQPIYFRISAAAIPSSIDESAPFAFGKAIVHRRGDDLTIIACGSTVHPALGRGRSTCGEGLFRRLHRHGDDQAARPGGGARCGCAQPSAILTVEEHNRLGGLGSAVAEVIAEEGVPVRVHRHGIYDEYSLIAPPTHLYAHYRLDASGIESVAMTVLASG